MARVKAEATITAADQFTGWVVLRGHFNISINGTSWTGTITLQRRFEGGTAGDVESHTSNIEKQGIEYEQDVEYRIGCKSTDSMTGSVTARISQ